MPMVDDGSGSLVQQAIMLMNLKQQQAQQQGRNQIAVAQPGQTVGDMGMSAKQFADMFGKDTPYDPKRQLKDEHASDIMDTNLKAYLHSLAPDAALNLSATMLANQSGVAGPTTVQGYRDLATANAARASSQATIATSTAPDVVRAGVAGAKADATTAEAKAATAQTVYDNIKLGIDLMGKTSDRTRALMGQTAAFGTTTDEAEQNNLKTQLGIAALHAALDAQTDPTAPIHKFLASQGLDLHTAMAAMGMGLTSLLDNQSRMVMQMRNQNKDAQNILLRMNADAAKEMSEKVFGGKLSPNQVMAIMSKREKGEALPASWQGAGDLYDRAIDVTYQTAMQQAIDKGDPMMIAMKTQIQELQKSGNDPHAISAVRDMTRTMAAYALTKQALGDRPMDKENGERWDAVFNMNKNRVPGVALHTPIFSTARDMTSSGIGSNIPGAPPAPTQFGVPVQGPSAQPVQPVAPAGLPTIQSLLPVTPGGQPAPVQKTPLDGMTDEQKKAIQDFVSTLTPSHP